MRRLKNDHWYRTAIRAFVLVVAVGGVSLTASAAARSEFQAFMDLTTGAAKHTVTFGGGGVPITTHGVPGTSAAGNMNFSHGAGQWPKAGGTFDLPSPIPGKTVPLTGKVPVNPAAGAKAIMRFATKLAFPITAGMAIYDLINELGGHATWDPTSGRNYFFKDSFTSNSYWTYGGVPTHFPSSSAACQTWANGAQITDYYVDSETQVRCYTSTFTGVIVTKHVLPDTPISESESEQSLEARIAAMSGWPSDFTAIDRVLADAANAGEAVIATPAVPTLTGTVPNVKSDVKTTTSTDGTTKTEETTCEWVAGINGVVEWKCWASQTTATSSSTGTKMEIRTNPDGTTQTTQVTESKPASTVTSTTTPETPTDGDSKCSEGSSLVGCAILDTPEGEIPKESKTITYEAEDLFGGGSCPSNVTAQIGTLGGSFTVWDWQKTCELALPLRALVMALAGFAAFLIVMPGRTAV